MRKILAITLISTALFGQQYYKLTGNGYTEGMHLLSRVGMEMSLKNIPDTPNSSSHTTFISDTTINEVNNNGKALTVTVITHTTPNDNEENMTNGKKVVHKFANNAWSIVSVDGEPPLPGLIESEGAISPVGTDAMTPNIPVAIGFKWDLPAIEMMKASGMNIPKEVYSLMTGMIKFEFNKISKINNLDCAVIKLKGKVKISATSESPSGQLEFDGVQYIDLQTGIMIKSDASTVMALGSMRMEQQITATVDILP